MPRTTIETDRAPAAVGPYAQGVCVDGLLFTAMQIALDPQTGELMGATHPEQFDRAFRNVQAIVEAGGGTLADLVKVTVYLTDMDAFGEVNRVYADFFSADLPARGVVQVAALPKGALIAVEAVARI